MSLHPQRRRVRFQPWLILWLTLVWLMLWGEVTWGNILAGVIASTVITVALPLPPVAFKGRFHLVGLIVLFGRFAWDLLVASIEISYIAATRRRLPRGGVIAVPMRSNSDLYMTIVSDFQTLVPGSLIVDANRETATLYVHIFDPVEESGVEEARRGVYELEERVLRAFGSDAEIAAAGLAPRGRLRWRIKEQNREEKQ
ncbi:MAG TPA: Na+/H+ antiporter subunit E [Actinomycetales bacterium]|nr:Na+/H+ antiporter subunit E [Actinomycetales bacterium]